MNKMRKIRIGKITINIGTGEPGKKLEDAYKLIKRITGKKPVRTSSKKRIPQWDVRPGREMGVKVTIREDFDELLDKLLTANDYVLKESSFDNNGNVSFGIDEYVHVPSLKYDPKIPLYGFNVTLTLERPGYRVKKRRLDKKKVGKNHLISKDEAIKFMNEEYDVSVE